jgi:RNA polymerase sigma-70 factor (ECF subfamily)
MNDGASSHPPTIADDDVALLSAFAAGNVPAFERLYQRHQAALYRFVRRLLGRTAAAQADEVFQDTWMRVLQSRARYSPRNGAQFRTWLFTLAHHRAIDALRRGGRELPLVDDDQDEPFEPAGKPWQHWPRADQTIDNLVFWRRAGVRLLDCLEQLPTLQRATFLLHHEDGVALDEIAKSLDVGFETAKSRLRYAMAKLRTCMGAYLDAANLGTRP